MRKKYVGKFDPGAKIKICEPGVKERHFTNFVSVGIIEESKIPAAAKYGNFTEDALPYLLVGAVDLINQLVKEINSSPKIKEKIGLALAAMNCTENVLKLGQKDATKE